MARGIQVGTDNIDGVEIPLFVEEYEPSLGYFKSNLELFEYYYKIATDQNIDPQILHDYADFVVTSIYQKKSMKSQKAPLDLR